MTQTVKPERASRRAAPKASEVPSGDRPGYPTGEGLT